MPATSPLAVVVDRGRAYALGSEFAREGVMAFVFDGAAGQRVRAAAAAAIEKYHAPGIAVGVVVGDDLVFAEGFGLADIESGEAMTADRRQRVASVTKTMVGLCSMALVDEGRLRLDDRIVDHLPEIVFDGPAETMTVRHLLTHTAGMGEAPTQAALANTVNPNPEAKAMPGGFATLYPDGILIEATPGTKWAYANHGYALLGEILIRSEKASSLQEILERRIFGPLGMRDSDVLDEQDARLTSCYHHRTNDDTRALLERAGMKPPDETPIDGHNIRGRFTQEFNKGMCAAGAAQSTIADMARYASALLKRGAGIVRPETFEAMVAPQWCPDERMVSWGLSFARTPRSGRRTFGHGGAYFGGWNTNLCVIPEENIAIIQFMNIMLDTPGPIFSRIIRAVLDAKATEYAEPVRDPSLLDSAPGMYECTPGRLMNFRLSTKYGRVQIYADEGALFVRSRRGPWKSGARLLQADASDPLMTVVEQDDGERPQVLLARDASGRVDGLRCDDLVQMVRAQE